MNSAEHVERNISVVIPAYGRCEHLAHVVGALLTQTIQPREILIGHSGSNDPSEILESMDTRVKVFHSENRMSGGAARNRAAEHASGDWLAFLDADVLPDAKWLEAFLNAVDTLGDACYFAGSVGYVRSGGYWGLCLWMIEFGSQHPYMPAREVQTMGGLNGFVARSHFNDAGKFPVHEMTGEDAFFQRQLGANGLSIQFWPCAVGRHFNITGFQYFITHIAPLARGSARMRRRFSYRGSIAARNPIFALGLLPARLVQIYARVLRWGRGYRLKLLWLTPGIVLGLAQWTASFAREAGSVDDDLAQVGGRGNCVNDDG